ncbi:MAG: TetR/AcrR family transcriptional regulator, partial [Bacteroidota bacterium]
MQLLEATQTQIIDTALNIFLQKGIKALTMQKLAQELGVSSKTIYKLFGDKANLLRACLNVHYQKLGNQIALLHKDSEDSLIGMVKILEHLFKVEFEINPTFYADLNKFYPDIQDAALAGNGHRQSMMADLINLGKQKGLFLKHIDTNIFWIALRHLYSGVTRDHIYADIKASPKDLLEQTIFTFLRGICTPKGLV